MNHGKEFLDRLSVENNNNLTEAVKSVEKEHEIYREDLQDEAFFRSIIRQAKRRVVQWISIAVCMIIAVSAIIFILLFANYVYLLWGSEDKVGSLLSKIIEWTLVAGTSIFVKTQFSKPAGGDWNKKRLPGEDSPLS